MLAEVIEQIHIQAIHRARGCGQASAHLGHEDAVAQSLGFSDFIQMTSPAHLELRFLGRGRGDQRRLRRRFASVAAEPEIQQADQGQGRHGQFLHGGLLISFQYADGPVLR